MNKKDYWLKDWFLILMFAAWPLGIPIILGLIALYYRKKENDRLKNIYGEIDQLEDTIKTNEEKKQQLNDEIGRLKDELNTLECEEVVSHYDFSEYAALTSEDCKNKLAKLKLDEKQLIKDGKALIITSNDSKKEIKNNEKQLLRCFNAECDNLLFNISVKNIDSIRTKVTKAFESLNKIFETDGMKISNELLSMKLDEITLVYTAELKKEEEREIQKAIKEQMIEEEKVRKEIEKEKAKLEKDQNQCQNEVNKLMGYLQKSKDDIERQLYVDKIKELEAKIAELETQKATVLEREANARAGYVYVISNIGSFGDDVYKIGMTRRLEPMDRIKELSSASVPFEFDVHAMIFSDDAPALETSLHKHFEKQSVNKVNLRKEFFHVNIDDIEKFVKENFNNTTEFTKIPVAREYRQSLEIEL